MHLDSTTVFLGMHVFSHTFYFKLYSLYSCMRTGKKASHIIINTTLLCAGIINESETLSLRVYAFVELIKHVLCSISLSSYSSCIRAL